MLLYHYTMVLHSVNNRTCISLPQAPSEYEANPEMLFYRITHLTRGKQYLIWASAVTTAGRGNISEKVTVEPAGKGKGEGDEG